MILLTGGTGLAGSHLLYALASRGKKVRALKRESGSIDLVKKIFLWYSPEKADEYLKNVEWVPGDLNDIFSLQDALKGVKQVYHCAAVVSFLPAERNQMIKTNVEGTANLVNLCLDSGVEKFCHCSSVAAIGRPEQGNVIDENLVWKTSTHNSGYAISKYGAEREVWRASAEGLPVVIVNPVIIIGPGDMQRSSAQLFLSVKKGLKFYPEGVTGFVDARDVAKAMIMLMESDISSQRFILSSENLSYKTIFHYFAEYSGSTPPRYKAGRFLGELAWRFEKARSLITGHKPLITRETAQNANAIRYFSNEKIKKMLGFEFIPVREAARNTARFYQELL